MRLVFLVADYEPRNSGWWNIHKTSDLLRLRGMHGWLRRKFFRVDQVFGGTLNTMRQCAVARACGADAVLATMSGEDTYGEKGVTGLPYIRWQDRRHDDICIVPDIMTDIIDEVSGPVVAYLQSPIFVKTDFNYRDPRVLLWTDSPFMLEVCRRIYGSEKPIEIVPNIIDNSVFNLIPQSERESGLIFAFPRKEPQYIADTQRHYAEMGGSYWHFELIDGISIHELAQQFRRPQAFLASAVVEGCALPPQESMASGIVVVGRDANGANFCMEHRQTAMIAETPEAAARCLIELENAELRVELAQNAYQSIKQYFPHESPTEFWQQTLQAFELKQA
jgi:glycosyltransferase involved in cell wall biosynthesis